MAISLSSLNRLSVPKPPRIVIYGPHGIGKNTFAGSAPRPVLINLEDGHPAGQAIDAFTQALGALLVKATGQSLTDYMREKLVEPLGFESDCYWLVDGTGMEMAFAGLNVTARDFAKLGELYRNNGRWNGQQIVPEDWVDASVRVSAPHLAPGQPILADHPLDLGYGYQWWLPDGDRGEFSAIGIYNEFVYVDPSRAVTIVKLSANPAYGTSMDEATNREMENIAFLREIAASFDRR